MKRIGIASRVDAIVRYYYVIRLMITLIPFASPRTIIAMSTINIVKAKYSTTLDSGDNPPSSNVSFFLNPIKAAI